MTDYEYPRSLHKKSTCEYILSQRINEVTTSNVELVTGCNFKEVPLWLTAAVE